MLTAMKFAIGVGLAIVLPALSHLDVATSQSAPLAPTYSKSEAYDLRYHISETNDRANELREFWVAPPFGKS